MKEQTGTLAAVGGEELFRCSWLPDDEPAAALAVVHGYGEHGGRYRYLVDAMVPLGYAVHVFDLRGHGRSPGVRGHIERFADYVGDAGLFVDAIAAEQPGTPLYLLGHSLGGLIATAYAEERPDGLAGLILSSPFLRLKLPIGGVKRAAAKVLSRVAPTRDIGNSIPADELSHEPEVVAAYTSDPLNHHVATARWAAEALAAQGAALSAAGRLELPLLVMYAGADTIADPAASRELYAAASSADKTLRCYEGYYHELFNEVGRADVFADLAAWLEARLA
ncbi:MAG: lysophospholipase [Actinomycetes bacterium]